MNATANATRPRRAEPLPSRDRDNVRRTTPNNVKPARMWIAKLSA